MKLLFVTRKIDKNDPRVGFVLDWVNEMASHLERLYVITWQESNKAGLAENIELIDLKGNKFFRIAKFKWQLWKIMPKVDGVFTHMMPQYAILAGIFAKIFRKKIYHWYAHGSVPTFLKISQVFIDGYVTSSLKGFRMKTKKNIIVTGQGIKSQKQKSDKFKIENNNNLFKIITVGRISPSKDYESMIKAVYEMNNKSIKLVIIGVPATRQDEGYFDSLKMMVVNMKLNEQVKFEGAVEHDKIEDYLTEADLFLNLSNTGSLDKAVLEAMSVGLIVLTSNEAFSEIVPERLMVEKDNPKALQEKIQEIINLDDSEKEKIILDLQTEVKRNHSLENLINKIVEIFEK